MDRRTTSHLLVLPALAVALLLAVAGCGGGDDDTAANSDGGAPPSTTVAGLESEWSEILRDGYGTLGVVDSRAEGTTTVLVMEAGSTAEDADAVCEVLADFDGSVSIDVDGTVTPCP